MTPDELSEEKGSKDVENLNESEDFFSFFFGRFYFLGFFKRIFRFSNLFEKCFFIRTIGKLYKDINHLDENVFSFCNGEGFFHRINSSVNFKSL